MNASGALTDLLYPPACLICRAPHPFPGSAPRARPGDRSWRAGGAELVCRGCAARLSPSGPPVCARCGIGLPGACDALVECRSCREHPPAFDAARAPWSYAGAAEEAVRQFKFHRRWRLGRWLAEEMASVANAAFPVEEVSAILPVPQHWLKRRLGGFHGAGRLADAVARSLGKPCRPDALRCRRWTATQSRLPWRTRARNVRDAFAARGRFVRGRSVLLVDDVLTSGATADACARALKAAGARRVFVLAAARTPLR